jgi:hypothetical protein
MDSRRNVRAALCRPVSLQGTDRWGKPFKIQGISVDFSRRGLGLIIEQDILALGSTVEVGIPGHFVSNAVVQWSRSDGKGRVRVGLKMLHFKASLALRVAASLLICVALVSQLSYGRWRHIPRRQQAAASCTVSLERMKSVLEKTLGAIAAITQSDKAFLHLQHERLGCNEYARLYEQSDFFDARKRAALANWHWAVYHGGDEKQRIATLREIEAFLKPADRATGLIPSTSSVGDSPH